MLNHEDLTEKHIAAAMDVHCHLGPGLLEADDEERYCHELKMCGIAIERQEPLPLEHKRITLDCGYRMDVVGEQ